MFEQISISHLRSFLSASNVRSVALYFVHIKINYTTLYVDRVGETTNNVVYLVLHTTEDEHINERCSMSVTIVHNIAFVAERFSIRLSSYEWLHVKAIQLNWTVLFEEIFSFFSFDWIRIDDSIWKTLNRRFWKVIFFNNRIQMKFFFFRFH